MRKLLSMSVTFVTIIFCMLVVSFDISATGSDFESATEIRMNSEYTDNIANRSDKDFYKFTLSSPGCVQINFKHENLFNSDEYWYAVLYNEKTEIITTYSFSGSETDVNAKKIGLDTGTYYLRITGGKYSDNWGGERYNTCNYALTIVFTESNHWEKEINDAFNQATPVLVNNLYTASINGRYDYDFYMFELSTSGSIQINFQHENLFSSEEYWCVTLYNSNADVITNYSFYGSDSDVDSKKIGLDTGNYYLRIVGGKYSSNWGSERYNTCDYGFTIKFMESKYWEKENSDSFSTADDIERSCVYNGTIHENYDKDYYRLNLSYAQSISINFNITNLNRDGELYCLTIYDEKTNIIDEYSISNDNKNVFITYLDEGIYYLRVTGGDYSSNWGSENYTTSEYTFYVEEYIYVPTVAKINVFSESTASHIIKWSKLDSATGYEVYRYNVSAKKYEKIKTTSSNKLKVKNLKSGSIYKYKVRGYVLKNNTKYYGDFSAVVFAPTKPSQVALKSVKSTKTKTATVLWDKVSGASGYVVVYATDSKFKKAKTVTVKKGSTLKATIKKLSKGKKYYFKVRAYKTVNGKKLYGAYSAVKNIKVK